MIKFYRLVFSFVIIAFSFYFSAIAQTVPVQGINYQAIARDANGVALANASIGVQIKVLTGNPPTNVAYLESHQIITNQFGLFNIVIGNGTSTIGNIQSIAWASNSHFLEVSIDPLGGTNYISMGITQFQAVPYAFHAGTAQSGVAGATGATGLNGTNGNNGIDGATGASGNNGIDGATGATGNNGLDGATGATGNNGLDGATGATGNNGIDGATGATGNNGIDGATGATGNNGLDGATGATGNNGIDGATGATGTNGLDGSTGATGNNGVDGATGATGNNGVDGATGATGNNGIDGAAGATGNNGIDGATGATGNNGLDGATGATGNNGLDGATGATGNNGLDGATGATGNNGLDGATGNNGLDGATGATGLDGTNGLDGSTGATGLDGTNGTDGIDGATGATGLDGTNGTDGIDGATGATGLAGTNGIDGIDGATGATGLDGTNGVDGATGATGLDGTNGVDGIDGATGATGLDGTNGVDGIDGATGATGLDGTNGVDGIDGATGATGNNGLDGATGATGNNGLDGATGATGNNGIDGATGATGNNGIDGATGATGNNGLDGATGATGNNGIDGATGATGLNSLTNLTFEPAGVNCINGGQLMETGTDLNNDGFLDFSEVTSTSYICNGADGAANAWALLGNTGTVEGVDFIGTIDSVDLEFRTVNNLRMTIKKDGLIGMGIKNPMSALQITNDSMPYLLLNSAVQEGGFYVARSGGIIDGMSATPANFKLGEFGFGGHDGIGIMNSGPAAGISAFSTESFSTGNGARLHFYTTNIGSVQKKTRMIINGNGNVSIGENPPNPFAKLHIQDTVRGILIPRLSTAQRTAISGLNNSEAGLLVYDLDLKNFVHWDGTAWDTGGGGSNAWELFGNNITDPNSFIGTTNEQDFAIKTFSLERMRVTSTGRVGIGTNAPGTVLHIASDTEPRTVLMGSSISEPGFLIFRSDNVLSSPSAPPSGFTLGIYGLSGYNGLTWGPNGPNAGMSARTSQNWSTIGMGTELIFTTTENDAISSTNRMIITHNGNIGIGVSVPTSKLQVAGDIGLGAGTAATSDAITVVLVNNTAALAKGDIVIIHPTTGISSTNINGHTSVVGVMYENCGAGQECRVAISGVVEVKAGPNGSVRGQHVITSTTPGGAGSVSTPGAGSSIGLWLDAVGSGAFGRVILK
ncbi:MAG TPA: calcium-binding protein [Bacteroidia bacterium]|nr:calcium-binding protein [Bacteroidia bacterium]